LRNKAKKQKKLREKKVAVIYYQSSCFLSRFIFSDDSVINNSAWAGHWPSPRLKEIAIVKRRKEGRKASETKSFTKF
jgi:hypothetical protein